MKIIDILNKMADGTLENGFKFKYANNIWKYDKNYNTLKDKKNTLFGDKYVIESGLTDRVEVIEDKEEIADKEEIEKIKLDENGFLTSRKGISYKTRVLDAELIYTINELVQAVNELKKEDENGTRKS